MTTTTKKRPILFSGPMVRAIIDGRKSQTRRVITAPRWSDGIENIEIDHNGEPLFICEKTGCYAALSCPYGRPGSRLWVRETWNQVHHLGGGQWAAVQTPRHPSKAKLIYAATCADGDHPPTWRPSIHMPRWASRLTLEITDVRVERLQAISEEDAKAEGFAESWNDTWWQGYRKTAVGLNHEQFIGDEPPDWMIEPKKMDVSHLRRSAVQNFAALWDTINGPGSWDANPLVWVVGFQRV